MARHPLAAMDEQHERFGAGFLGRHVNIDDQRAIAGNGRIGDIGKTGHAAGPLRNMHRIMVFENRLGVDRKYARRRRRRKGNAKANAVGRKYLLMRPSLTLM
jgi:hypothetical protein